jgi:hypothetical protein
MQLNRFRLLICGALFCAATATAAAASKTLPDFSAVMHVIDRSQGEMYSASVAMGKYGIRSETAHPRYGKMITIANFSHKTCSTYLVDKQAYYVEPLDPASPDCDLDLDRLFGEYAGTRNTYSYHALGSSKPCQGYKARKLGEELVNQRETQKWECTDPINTTTFTQWFDPRLGRVIKHQEVRITKEYSDIKVRPLARSQFAELHGFHKYSQNAFFDLLRIPAFSTNGKKPANMDKLLPNDRLQICMENCQAALNKCSAGAKTDADNKRCDTAFDRCAENCEKQYPPQ